MATSKELFARLSTLENDFLSQGKKLDAARASLARAYGEGVDPAPMIIAVSDGRASCQAMREALASLDKAWFQSAAEEYDAAVKGIADTSRDNYLTLEKALDKVAGEALAPIFKKADLDTKAIFSVMEGAKSAAWDAFQGRDVTARKALGPRPVPRPPRPLLAD